MRATHYLEVHLLRSCVGVYLSQDLLSVLQVVLANQNPSWEGMHITHVTTQMFANPTYVTLVRKTRIRAEDQPEQLRAQPSISIRGARGKTLGRWHTR